MRPASHRLSAIFLGTLGFAVALGAAAPARGTSSPMPDADAVRRLLTLLGAVGEEYREAFDEGGTLVRPLEHAEAQSFLAEARQRASALAGPMPADLSPRLASLAAAVDARAPVARVTDEVRALGEAITATTGVAGEMGPPAPPSAERGRALYATHCPSCHGAGGAGDGPEAARLARRPADFTDAEFMRGETPIDFFHVISLGRRGAAMPAWEDVLSVQERWDLVAYLWTLSVGGLESARVAALKETTRLLAAAVDAYRRGDPAAADAYLRFEPIEPPLRTSAPALVRRVEERFMALRAALARPAMAPEVERLRGELGRDLGLAESALATTADAPARFVQAATIILREGIEVVLIVGALLAYVVKSGSPAMKRPIYVGTAAGLVASVAAAALVATALRWAPATPEIIEGASMLLAAAVLFWVSYWLVSKAEADHWQRYLHGKVRHALTAGSGVALAAAAFLAVFREGCETVLFYQALFAGAPRGDVATIGGLTTGAALLGLVSVAFVRFGKRMPLRPFFRATGALLYAMAIAFAGRGVYELQEAGVLRLTPVPGVPRLPVLGVFPSAEALCAQGVLVVLLGYALVVTLRGRREEPETTPAPRQAAGGR